MELEFDVDPTVEGDLAALELLPTEETLTGGGLTTACDFSTLIDVQC